ncbi:MAG: hypothetical protein KJ630_05205 [Proteobacteria bacterium]|nr:hypothetical protein [Pseudomonadota bacterium]
MNIVRNRIPLIIPLKIFLALSIVVLLLSGCVALSNYSAASYEHLTQLKAFHLKFINDFTTEISQKADINKVAQAESTGDLKFREAEAYAQGMNDESRTYNIQVLRSMFIENVSWLKNGETFGKSYAEQQEKILTLAYDQAIKGEKYRKGAPTK